MTHKGKLSAALSAHKGRDYKLEKQKMLQKHAERRKRDTIASAFLKKESELELKVALQSLHENERHQNDAICAKIDLDPDEPSQHPLSSSENGSLDDGNGDGIPLSDIASISSSQAEDLVPYQRLTINNSFALLKSHKSIALPTTLSFSANQTITSTNMFSIPDVNNDLNRELAFYKQCLDAATQGRVQLRKEEVSFTRPNDYFAEMVKSDEHMGKIQAKMTEEAATKKASAEARKQRDLKKFGKQVQVAKLQERDRAKRDTMEKINILKRKRKDADTGHANEDDLFDVALEDASKGDKSGNDRTGGQIRKVRQNKDAKFGFGGKKRFAKSGDAMSSGDLKGFSTKKMKEQKKGTRRLGKSKRAKQS